MASRFLLVGLLLATCSLVALASDPSPLQDFCVADSSKVPKSRWVQVVLLLYTSNRPEGLIHFQQNVGNSYAVAIAALSSQNPGVITTADAVFGSNPDISDDILARAFQVDKKVIGEIKSKF
ncbi:hypothetical protein CTI12_AA614000 [Artemisia annua]|uniref:Germin-like protein n=1 Tax=Artemisia annua TaxID=35608 RepID=A0A2U1KDL4_ARTAN|nr:hypothetical protein CTI12_AA614000 [Artemisia annua]